MIEPEDFVRRWTADAESSQLLQFGALPLEGVKLTPSTRGFLERAGLPKDAAPFLSSEVPTKGKIPTVSEVYRGAVVDPRYRMIGSNNYGDPICIDENEDGTVVCLIHDDEFKVQYMNASIRLMAECLLAFRNMFNRWPDGADGFHVQPAPLELREQIRADLLQIDPSCLKTDSVWTEELVHLAEEW